MTRRRYRIDFALLLITGNLTRYITLRPVVDSDTSVSARWFPIRTWIEDDPLRFLPVMVRVRLRHWLDTWKLYVVRPPDAMVIHAFETYTIYTIFQRLLRRKVLIINNPDAGIHDEAWLKPHQPRLRSWLRRKVASSTDLFVPWSDWAASRIRQAFPWLPEDRITVLHPGIDLRKWHLRHHSGNAERFRILFVGGDLRRKGVDTLLDAFEQRLGQTCELNLATQSGYLEEEYRRRVAALHFARLYLDLEPGSEELKRLYAENDALVLPTNLDTSSWVALEAMATGIPVVITPMGGIPDIVRDGETGLLIPPRSPDALANAVDRLRLDPALRSRLRVQGRAHIEEHYDAQKNTGRLLEIIKAMIDSRHVADCR